MTWRKAVTLDVLLLMLGAFLGSCSSGGSTSSQIADIPLEKEYFKGTVVPLPRSSPTDSSVDSVFRVPSHPNPFSPSTTVDSDVTHDDTVSIHFYDGKGNPISEVFRGYLVTGAYRLMVDDAHVNSGVYFVKLTLGDRSFFRKVIIMR
jgi:hypothetical protein